MAFQPSAFQFDAFQMAAGNANRSGVIRLWLAQLTAELNGMIEKEEPKQEVVEEKQPELAVLKENADGSVSVSEPTVEVAVKKKVKKPITLKPFNKPTRPLRVVDYEKRNLPSPTETADFIFGTLSTEAKNQVWVEEQILELLREQADEFQEDELLVEAAIHLLF